jgi:hypothetical protein
MPTYWGAMEQSPDSKGENTGAGKPTALTAVIKQRLMKTEQTEKI